MKKVETRKNLNLNDQWDLSSIFASEEDFEKEINLRLALPPAERWKKIMELRPSWTRSEESILKMLELCNGEDERLSKLYTYAYLKHDEDLNNDTWKSFSQKVTFLYQDFFQNISWLEPELLELDEKRLIELSKSKVLNLYHFYLKTLFNRKEHTLSSEKEELISLTSLSMSTAQKTFSLLNNVDIVFPQVKDGQSQMHELTHGTYRLFQRGLDRELRKNSFVGLHQKFMELQNTCCELLTGHVQQHIFDMKARGYRSSLAAALHPKNIDNKVYHNLIDTVRQNIGPLHDYVKVRKELLKLEQIHLYDLQPPPVERSLESIPYEEAVKWIIESVAPLGDEYQSVLANGLQEDRWVDRYENLHKRSGAYSSGCYQSHPYILMNYKGTINDVFTLAHEAGHSMHTYFSHKNQPYPYARYPIFVAEVASTFNETLLMHHLLKSSSSEQMQLILLHEKIEELRATLFRQTMFAEFELFIHDSLEKNQPLTASFMNDYYLKLNQDYYGPHITLDPEIAIEWARVPHFYSNFYVYQYATGISAALTLAKGVLENKENAQKNYLQFLSAGGHAYPIDLLKIAGVDMTSPEPVKTALGTFKEFVDKLKGISLASSDS